MRDDGLRLAIDAAGGISALARGLGIAQPSVSSWSRVPAERVVVIEALTGVRRERLRPDLYGEVADAVVEGGDSDDDVGSARAGEYLLLAALLRHPVTSELLERLRSITGDATPLGLAHIALAQAAGRTAETAAGREFFNLFIGVGRGELLPYASFYLTGFLNERPLGRVREDLNRLGIERSEGNHDPEDHVATLLEVMAGLSAGDIAAEPGAEQAFFERHLKPWVLRFFADLAVAEASDFYKAVAAVGAAFIDIETQAFAMPEASLDQRKMVGRAH
jgi:TorA maturation chaperone TorD/DNA-binding transcriptional regulator YdaS (Cro superfamily)